MFFIRTIYVLCCVTGTLKDVVYNEMIQWNPDTQGITVTTNSAVGSGEKVVVWFYDNAGNGAGRVWIYFSTPILYELGWCTYYNNFPVSLPVATQKTWTITYNTAELSVAIHCNGVQALTVLLSDSECADSDWRTYWERKPTQILFPSYYDTASKSYCFSSHPGKLNAIIGDSGQWNL